MFNLTFLSSLFTRFLGGFLFLICSLTIGFSFGWIVRGWNYDSDYKEAYLQAISAHKAQDLANKKISEAYHRKNDLYQKEVVALNEKVATEISQNNVYSRCALSNDGVQLINSAISSANSLKSTK